MPDKVSKKLVELYDGDFTKEIVHRSRKIDPDEEYDWYSLTVGWALAKGLTINQAHDFSVYARYTRHYQ